MKRYIKGVIISSFSRALSVHSLPTQGEQKYNGKQITVNNETYQLDFLKEVVLNHSTKETIMGFIR